MSLTLTNDQQRAYNQLISFLADKNEPVFVLSGYAGTGKSTMIRHVLDNVDTTMAALRLIDPKLPHYTVELTATTNKAADNLSQITGKNVSTIHSFLSLIVHTDYTTGKSRLIKKNSNAVSNKLLFIDEASYIDSQLLDHIFKILVNCKIVFFGDPAQLVPVKYKSAPVFQANFTGAQLTEVIRQEKGNPVLDLATQFRQTVTSGEFFKFKADSHYVQHLSRDAFNEALIKEFTEPNWTGNQSKILAWTNKTVEKYNKEIYVLCKGSQKFQVGDYVQNNKYYVAMGSKPSFKTDEMVYISSVGEHEERHGVWGHTYGLNNEYTHAFCPDNIQDKEKALKQLYATNDFDAVRAIEESWIDLRSVYACTINKSQGSTYDRVFIDLDDLKKCNSGEQIARLLYVGVSRAKHQCIFTGDLV